jgi:hypothetical protein
MDIWIPLLSALLGAVVGAFSSIAAILVSAKFESKRAQARLAVEAAIQEYGQHLEIAKESGKGFWIPPLSLYVYYNSRVIDLLERGQLTAKALEELSEELEEMKQAIPRRR